MPWCHIYCFFSRFIHRRKSHGCMLDIKRMGKCYQSCARGSAGITLANNECTGNSLKVFIYPGVCKVRAVYLVWCFSFLADAFSIFTWKSWLKYDHRKKAAFHERSVLFSSLRKHHCRDYACLAELSICENPSAFYSKSLVDFAAWGAAEMKALCIDSNQFWGCFLQLNQR